MLQRIQTLFLLIVVILSGFTLFAPSAHLLGSVSGLKYMMDYKGIVLLTQHGKVVQQNVWALTTLSSFIPLIALVTILAYKKRLLQIRMTIINVVLMAGYYGLLFIYLWQMGEKYHAAWTLTIVTAFPLVNVVLSLLAIRAIGKDETLIRSLNRLR